MSRRLSDLRKLSDEEIVANISNIVYKKAVALEFEAGIIEELRKLVDELEYRIIISPIINSESL